jgi:hypothetical protein
MVGNCLKMQAIIIIVGYDGVRSRKLNAIDR